MQRLESGDLKLRVRALEAERALGHVQAWQRVVSCASSHPCVSLLCPCAGTMQRLESGDLKLRVRALEAERALGRVQAWQRVVSCALVASTLVNVGTVLSVSAMATGASLSFAGAGVFGLLLLSNYMKVGFGEASTRCWRGCWC
jgi:hypothetical protein